MTRWQNPEKFLDDLAKHGTNEKNISGAFTNLNKAKSWQDKQRYKVDIKDFVGRQNYQSVTLKKLDMITDAPVIIMDTIEPQLQDFGNRQIFEQCRYCLGQRRRWSCRIVEVLQRQGKYIQLPESKSYGALAGKYVPKDILDQVMGVVGEKMPSSKIAQTWQKMVYLGGKLKS